MKRLLILKLIGRLLENLNKGDGLMCKYFGIKYEKRFHISEEDALLAGVDVEKENDILG